MSSEQYKRVNGAWPEGELPKLTGPEAIAAVRKLYRLGMGRTWQRPIALTSGNRYTWPRRGVYYVNPDRGWWHLVHDVSHRVHRSKFAGKHRPHDFRHAMLEKEMIEHVVSQGWLDGKLRQPEAPTPDRQAERYARVLARIEAWEKKLRRAETALRKLRRSAAYYERAAVS